MLDVTPVVTSTPHPTPTTTPESLEIFEESDDSVPVHVNYDFTKSEPLSIINDEDFVPQRPRRRFKRHYKIKK